MATILQHELCRGEGSLWDISSPKVVFPDGIWTGTLQLVKYRQHFVGQSA